MPVVFVSSLIVFAGTSWNGDTCYETDWCDDERVAYGGYAQSKLEAEKRLQRMASQYIHIKIVRPGLLSGSRICPRFPKESLWARFTHGCFTLGCVPPDRKSTRLNSSHLGISYA